MLKFQCWYCKKMSASATTCRFFTPSLQARNDTQQLQPQPPVENKEVGTFSQNEYATFKKPRICEDFILDPRVPVVPKKVMGGSFKTRLCQKFSSGHCSYGENCQFAHGNGDIRNRGPHSHWQVLMSEDAQWRSALGGDYRVPHETKVCRRNSNGRKCAYSNSCRFLHEIPEKKKQEVGSSRENYSGSIASTGHAVNGRSGSRRFECKWSAPEVRTVDGRVNQKLVFWKTKLCNNWKMTKSCPYGKACYFAHGQEELKKLGTHIALDSGTVLPNILKTYISARNEVAMSFKQKVQGSKCMFNWKEIQKRSGIYADWIEDVLDS